MKERDQDKDFPKMLFSLPPESKFALFPIYSKGKILSKYSQVELMWKYEDSKNGNYFDFDIYNSKVMAKTATQNLLIKSVSKKKAQFKFQLNQKLALYIFIKEEFIQSGFFIFSKFSACLFFDT